MNSPLPTSLAIYARKSTESEDRQVMSIDSQVKELKMAAEREGLKVSRIFVESKSAKAPGRPVFNELFSLVQKGQIDAVMSWKLDRIARNPVDGGAVIWAMDERRLKALYTPQRVFVNTGNDKFWMQLEFGMAKKYVDDLSDNVKRGVRARLSLGHMSGMPPLGYVNDRNRRIIVKDPERFQLVRRMWDLMLTGNHTPPTIQRIATDEWGLRTRQFKRHGGRPISVSGVYKMFAHPFYYGIIRHNGESFQGAHEAMVTRSEFDQVQRLLSRSSNPRPEKHTFAYTGLIRCGECGSAITAENKCNRQGHKYVYYHCTRHLKTKKCSQRVIEVKKLEAQISLFLGSITIPVGISTWALAVIRQLEAEETAKDDEALNALKRRHTACKAELASLVDLRLKNLVNDEEYLQKKAQLESEQISVKTSLDRSDRGFETPLAQTQEVLTFAASAKSAFENGDNDVRKACVQYIGSNLSLRDGILNIHAQKPFAVMRDALRSIRDVSGSIEPVNSMEGRPKSAHTEEVRELVVALVHDLRTFYRDHRLKLDTLRMPHVLKSIIRPDK